MSSENSNPENPQPTGGRKARSRLKSRVLAVLVTLLLLEVILHLVFYASQDVLLFHRVPLTPSAARVVQERYPELRMLEMTAADGTRLQGWAAPAARDRGLPAILYFGGNGDEISGTVAEVARETGRAVVGMNYRGYGLSGGVPGETAIFADALVEYDELTRRKLIDPRSVILMGRSLGSGVAVYLAGQRPACALILVTPYDSITSVAQGRYPFLWVRLITKNPFDSLALAPRLHLPLLLLIADQDRTIPPSHARRLAKRYGGPVTLRIIAGAGHNDIFSRPELWQSVKAFLAEQGGA